MLLALDIFTLLFAASEFSECLGLILLLEIFAQFTRGAFQVVTFGRILVGGYYQDSLEKLRESANLHGTLHVL